MKAITLTQPWATLAAIRAKRIDTRSWSTKYRGPLAIHAAKGLGPVGGKTGLMGLVANEPFLSVLSAWCPNSVVRPDYWLPMGAIVATCELTDVWPIVYQGEYQTELSDGVFSFSHWHAVTGQELAFGDYSPGRYAWLLDNVQALPEPIPAKGALSLWEWNP